MVPTRTWAAVGAASLAALGLALAPLSAMAADGDLFSWGYTPGTPDAGGFAAVSPTDASLTLLGTDTIDTLRAPTGVEVCDGTGYAFGTALGDAVVLTFDPATGATLSAPTALTIPGGTVDSTIDADTLADCTLLTVGYVTGEDDLRQTGNYVLRVDASTGTTEPLAFLGDFYTTGIATSPSGTTSVFTFVPASPAAAVVDLQTATLGSPVILGGFAPLYDDSMGESMGVDFDSAGVLWAAVTVTDSEDPRLASFAAGDLATAAGTDHGPLLDSGTGVVLVDSPVPLAVGATFPGAAGPGSSPQLAATGTGAPLGLYVGAALLVAAGAAVVVTTRRRSA